jgi:hypothetical protein
MGHDYECGLLPLMQIKEHVCHHFARGTIEIASRLITQQEGRPADKCPGEGHSLALAARQFGWTMVQSIS